MTISFHVCVLVLRVHVMRLYGCNIGEKKSHGLTKGKEFREETITRVQVEMLNNTVGACLYMILPKAI